MSHLANKTRKLKAYQAGLEAEDNAATLLEERGFSVLGRRFRSPAGEIDLIAANGSHLSFVEVKARRNLVEAAWAVTPRQQRRIAEAASHWLQCFPEYEDHDITFDAILVAPRRVPEYIPDAFRL
jgi:putative endonuclease